MNFNTPGDLPAPSTSRNLLPRSRASSAARPEAARSRPGSRNSSRSSRSFQGETHSVPNPVALNNGQGSGSSRPPQVAHPLPMEIDPLPNGLPALSTSRNPPPRSRAASLARSEAALSAPNSRPGSRNSSRSHQSLREDSMALRTTGETAETMRDPFAEDYTDWDSPRSPSLYAFSNWHPRLGYQLPTPFERHESQGMANWQDRFPVQSLSEGSGSASRRKRKRSGSPEANCSFESSADHTSDWQMPAETPPLRLAFERGSTSGAGSSSGSGPRSAGGAVGGGGSRSNIYALLSDTSPSSERQWKADADEVAGLLLETEGDSGSHFNSSSGPSSQDHPPKFDRKGKGKAKARDQTPEPGSVIEISDSPPAPTRKAEAPAPAAARPTKPVADPLSSYTCPICFSPPVNATLTPCGHICCGACLFAALKATMQRATASFPGLPEARCPVCRAIIPGWDGKGGGVIGLKARAIFRL